MTTLAHGMLFPDVKAGSPGVCIGVTRVGVTEIRKMVEIGRGDRPPVIMLPTFDFFVGPPSCRSGARPSPGLEGIGRTLEEALNRPVYAIDDLCVDVSRDMLAMYADATIAEVRVRGECMLERRSPKTNLKCQEVYGIYADATVTRDGLVRRTVGAEVVAMTACPCAREISRDMAFNKLRRLGVSDEIIVRFLDEMPMPTHNQRGIGKIMIRSDDGMCIPVESIIDIIESSMSSPMYQLLKREDEKFVVESAHQNPKFVEDCVRAMARNLVQRFPDLPEDAAVTIGQVNEESIHRHNVFAERTARFGDLKNELQRNGLPRPVVPGR